MTLLFTQLVQAVFTALIGALILRLALWPAFRMAGAPKGQNLRGFIVCYAVAFIWIAAFIAWRWGVSFAASQTAGFRGPQRLDPYILAAVGLIFPLGAYLAAKLLKRLAPLPRLDAAAVIAGVLVAAAVSYPLAFRPNPSVFTPLTTVISMLAVWILLPIAAVYYAALIQRRRLNRFTARRCVPCGYENVAGEPRCTECGAEPHFLCAKCRHVVDARPGDPCPRCKTPIAAACWNCGYNWTGLDSDRCPECGIWKPAAPTPEASPA